MNINRVAIIGFPSEDNIDTVLKNLISIGVNDLLLFYFEKDNETENELESFSTKFFMFNYNALRVSRKNLYGESIRLAIDILMRVEQYKACNVYFANQGKNPDIRALFDNISNILTQYFAEINRLHRRETYPQYSVTKCLWQNKQKYEYSLILCAKNMAIIEQIGYVATEGGKITSGIIQKKIVDTLILEDEREKPSDSSIKDHLRAIKKGFYGSNCYENYAQQGFVLKKEIKRFCMDE